MMDRGSRRPTPRRARLLFALVVGGSAVHPAAQAPNPVPSERDISINGFVQEALFGYGTPRTHRFDDYTKGSYSIKPREVIEGIIKTAPTYDLDLQAVAVVGPTGPLANFDVLTVIRQETCVRVNWLSMPHRRITAKRSACLPVETVASFLADLRAVASTTAPPAAKAEGPCLMLGEEGKVRWSTFDCWTAIAGDAERLDAALNKLLPSLAVTYGYPPDRK